MITRDQAEQIAAQFVGAPASDPVNGWDLIEFGAGWLIREHALRDQLIDTDSYVIGTGSYIVERASGRMLHFPSYVPPVRILEEYDQVADGGSPVHLRPDRFRERQ